MSTIIEMDRLQVDIYWPNEGGFGAPTIVPSLEAAVAEVEKLRRQHYGGPTTGLHQSVIEVRRITIERIPIEELQQRP